MNVRENHSIGVETLNVAAWSRKEKLMLSPYSFESSNDSMASRNRGTISTAGEPLDDLLVGENPSSVKIDVEGAEVEVLRGMERILAHSRPVITFEAREKTIQACQGILTSMNYFVTQMDFQGNYLATPR